MIAEGQERKTLGFGNVPCLPRKNNYVERREL